MERRPDNNFDELLEALETPLFRGEVVASFAPDSSELDEYARDISARARGLIERYLPDAAPALPLEISLELVQYSGQQSIEATYIGLIGGAHRLELSLVVDPISALARDPGEVVIREGQDEDAILAGAHEAFHATILEHYWEAQGQEERGNIPPGTLLQTISEGVSFSGEMYLARQRRIELSEEGTGSARAAAIDASIAQHVQLLELVAHEELPPDILAANKHYLEGVQIATTLSRELGIEGASQALQQIDVQAAANVTHGTIEYEQMVSNPQHIIDGSLGEVSLQQFSYAQTKVQEEGLQVSIEDHRDEVTEATAIDPAAEAENRIYIDQVLANVHPRNRAILEGLYIEDKTQTEVAEMLGISRSTVERQRDAALEQAQSLANRELDKVEQKVIEPETKEVIEPQEPEKDDKEEK